MSEHDDWQQWLAAKGAEHRFGERDRLGTANHIDDDARQRAVAAMGRGRTASLARPVRPQPSPRGDERPGFSVEVFYTPGDVGMGTDHVEMDCHGRHNTHLDGINHIAIGDTWYSGWAVDGPDGPDVTDLAGGRLFTRAVLADVARFRGSPWIDEASPVGGDDLEGAVAQAGVELRAGDALVVHMGRDRFEAAGHDFAGLPFDAGQPGIGRSGAEWIADHDVGVLLWDFLDTSHPDEPLAPVHMLVWAIGLILVDNCALTAAAEAMAADGVGVAALFVSPIAIPGGTGCLVRPDPRLVRRSM